MFSRSWNVPNHSSKSLAKNSTSAKGHIFPDLYLGQGSTLLTSSFIDSFFHSLTFHSSLYSSDPSFISLINSRWDTAWFPQTLEKLSVASSATQFRNMFKMSHFLLQTKSNKTKSPTHLYKLFVTNGWHNKESPYPPRHSSRLSTHSTLVTLQEDITSVHYPSCLLWKAVPKHW